MSPEERSLLEAYRRLDSAQQQSVLAFAEFLALRAPLPRPPVCPPEQPMPICAPEQPMPIARPENESVVKAIKRLSATYPMLDRKKLLHETSNLVNEHVMQGRDARAVIDAIEAVFARHYEKYKSRFDK